VSVGSLRCSICIGCAAVKVAMNAMAAAWDAGSWFLIMSSFIMCWNSK